MPPVIDVFKKHSEQIGAPVIIRLHGPDRKQIEELTGKDWSKIVIPKDDKLSSLPSIIEYFSEREIDVYVNVNNHFEGSAPLTIEKIKKLLD
jgi:uncharacterized protein YecE (DUF72 family)